MEQKVRAALYARVSSDRQEQERTIQSQLAELRAQVQADGVVNCQEFTDEGYSRDNLVRPSLDRLRDLAAQGEFDRLYVHCPDRLASGAKLVLLVEEFQQQSTEVVFLQGSVADSPEGKLLLHMQGAIAEYERTKITERTRRGKMLWAKQGHYMGGFIPYGYGSVSRDQQNGQRARLEVNEAEAAVVRDMYRWLIEEQLSSRKIARRLTEMGVPTRKGRNHWNHSTVDGILRAETYNGILYYHRGEAIEPSHRKQKNRYSKGKLTGRKLRDRSEWIAISVPPVVDNVTWEAAQRQLEQNSAFSPRHNTQHKYLLRGLVRCIRCGGAVTGAFHGQRRNYHCSRFDPLSTADGTKCGAGYVRADPVEEVVWQAVTDAFRKREVLKAEYERRLAETGNPNAADTERKRIETALKRNEWKQNRLLDVYLDPDRPVEMPKYKAKMDELRAEQGQLERQIAELNKRRNERQQAEETLACLDAFCDSVNEGLDNLTFEEKQQFLRLVVDRIYIGDGRVRIEGIIPLHKIAQKPVQLRPQCLDTENRAGRMPVAE